MFVYIEILFRYWRRFLMLLLLLPLTIGVVTVVFFPTYKATSQLWVESFADVGLGTPSGWNTYLTPSQNLADTLTQLLSTRDFNDNLYNTVVAGGFTTRAQRDDVAASIAGITVATPGTHLLAITGGCDQREVCVAVLSGLIDLFREHQVKDEQNQATLAITFFTEQLTTAKPALTAAQDAAEKYLAMHPNLRTDPNATTNDFAYARLLADLRDKQSRVDDLNNRVAHDQYIASASQEVLKIGPLVVDPPVIARSGLLGDGTSIRPAMFCAVGC